MMKPLTYVTFILSIANLFFALSYYEKRNLPPASTEIAIEPVLHIFNSKLYLQEKNPHRSKEELSMATRKLVQLMNLPVDKDSKQHIGRALADLENLKQADFTIANVNESYINALLMLSHIQLVYALECCGRKEKDDLIVAVQRAMFIVKKALLLSKGSDRELEADIYANMYEIAKRKINDPEQIKQMLTESIQEIEKLKI